MKKRLIPIFVVALAKAAYAQSNFLSVSQDGQGNQACTMSQKGTANTGSIAVVGDYNSVYFTQLGTAHPATPSTMGRGNYSEVQLSSNQHGGQLTINFSAFNANQLANTT